MRNNDLGDTARPAADSSFVSRFGGTLKGKKSRAALALAVSLWIATGGVASAETSIDPATKTVTIENEDYSYESVYGNPRNGTNVKEPDLTNFSGNTLIIKGCSADSAYGASVLGTMDSETGDVTKNALEITDSTIVYCVYGGNAGKDNAINNTVTLNNVEVGSDVYGGRVKGPSGGSLTPDSSGSATGNRVTINGGTITGSVYGGYVKKSTGGATGNTVTINSATVNGDVVGGQTKSSTAATGNTVFLNNATVAGHVYGGYISGASAIQDLNNTLRLSGVNTVGTNVKNFRTIVLDKSLQWNPDEPVLKMNSFTSTGEGDNATVLDFSELGENWAKPGTMTLLHATESSFHPNKIYVKGKNGVGFLIASGPQTLYDKDFSHEADGVTINYHAKHTIVRPDSQNIKYTMAADPLKSVELGEMTWGKGRDIAAEGFDFNANTKVVADKLTFPNPETITAGTTPLFTVNNGFTLAATEKNIAYTYLPVPGVTMDGRILGSYASSGNNVNYTVTANTAAKLTFTNVEWKDSGALLDHAATLTNISFNGADVDTTNINFTNLQSLEANKKMTLVSSFGNKVGTITGTKYKVGSTLEGEGKASLVGNDLIFTAETGTGGQPDVKTQEQTHNTVMGAEVGMAALSAGNDFIGNATEGLALASNIGADGVSSFAQMGGGTMRQETGSHIDVHTWNAIIALGHQNKKERGTFEYGAFFEYGSGNYSTFNGDERGDGSMHYTGGGLLAKYTTKNSVYVEGSLRAGTVHDDARNVLRDTTTRVPYSYETNAPYMGFHLGVGKEIAFDDMHAVNVYGRYFYNRRNSVSFDAGGHYDLDAVTSQTIRVGARYIVKRDKWNFYAGAAYEHELDGKAAGKADGVEIRGADTSGASFRGEVGATMKPGENSPWSLDLNVSGFAGKKRGFTGGVSVAFMF